MDELPEEAMKSFEAMNVAFFSKEIQACMAGVRRITHFDITPKQAQPFLRFHRFVTSPQPSFIARWRADPQQEHWYHTLVNGVLGDVRSALAAVEYHRSNLARIEAELAGFLELVDYKDVMPPGMTVGGGGSAKLDFEYQAFVVAYRRCLDYLTRALSAYFQRKDHSFREIPRKLGRAQPESVAQRLLTVREAYDEHFRFVMNHDGKLSVRDRIAHREAVGAGCVNITRFGVYLAGGGEDLVGWPKLDETLGVVLARRTEVLHACIAEMLDAFIAAASEAENRVG